MSHRSTGEWTLAVRQQASVARLGQVGLQGGDPDALLQEAMVGVADTLAVRSVILFELRPSWQELQIRGALLDGHVFAPGELDGIAIPAGRESMPGYTVMQGEAVWSTDLAGDQRFHAQAPTYGLRAVGAITAPIVWADRPWGVLGAYSDVPRGWTDDDVHYVQSVANTVGLALRRHRAEAELRDSSVRLDLSLRAGGLGAWSWDTASDHLELSGSALEMYGVRDGTFGGTGAEFVALVHPDDRAALVTELARRAEGEAGPHGVFRIVRPDDGRTRWIELWGRRLDEVAPDRLVGVSADVTDRRRAEAVKEALLAREQAARVEAEAAHGRLTVLAEASALLSTSLDPEVLVAELAAFCVPQLADGCVIELFDDLGAPTAVGAAGADETAGQVGVDAPLVARGRALGTLRLTLGASDPRRGPDHAALVEELASRAALAIDNARLFAARNRVARSLQAALLPPALPADRRLAFSARYRVAEADTQIGGDFYDLVEVAGPAWGVVMGDVCGRGPDAAALTGLVRHSVRAATVRESLPSRVLAHTNEAVLGQISEGSFCTAAYLRMEPTGDTDGSVRVLASSAGHPRPVVVRAGGGAELIDCAGQLLGVVPRPELRDAVLVLRPGDAVVLYTDGVIEARRGREEFGDGRLLEVLDRLAGAEAEELASGLEAEVTGFQDGADDDMAILVVQVRPLEA